MIKTTQQFRLSWRRGTMGLICLLVWGCVSLPVQEMSDARQAITAAKDAGAANRAPATLHEASRMMRSAEKALNKKVYSVARRDALRAKELAMQARRAALTEDVDEEP